MAFLPRAAAFHRGLSVFQAYLVCLLGASFAMKRFGYTDEAVPIFATTTLNAIQVLFTLACISVAIKTAVLKSVAPNYFNYIVSGMSMVSVCLNNVVSVLLLKTYALDDSIDNITKYYWLLCLLQFCGGIGLQLHFVIAGDTVASWELGNSSLNMLTTFLQWALEHVLGWLKVDINYWLVVCHIMFTVTVATMTSVLWIIYLIEYKIKPGGTTDNSTYEQRSVLGFLKNIPMLLTGAMSLAFMLSLFPTICPFELMAIEKTHPILLAGVIFDILDGFTVMALELSGADSANWYKGKGIWWHTVWLGLIPFIGIALIFFYCMHFPESFLGKIVVGSSPVIGFLSVVYLYLGGVLMGISFVPIFANADGYGEEVMALGIPTRQLTLHVCQYMSEAHVQNYHKAKDGLLAGKAWPTAGMSKGAAIRYWIRNAARVGYANFKEMASADVKQRLSSVPRNIVSYRRSSAVA